ncbi:MAG TPA: ankyrin repeat domain-containing protein, partial [Blastocatellia bacterium]|nr:ankyrin repeat domain-containing protein [Blastocatellia bacterium]
REDASRLDSFSAEGFTPLGLAAHFGHRETTEYLLAQNANASIVSRHPLQVTPLHAALFGRRIETARLLIEGGADVNIQRGGKGWPRAGWTALHYASGFGLIELIEPLLARGADLNTLDGEGRTPLGVAIEEKQDQVAERLRQKGAQE